MSEWAGYVLENFRFDFAAGSKVLDLGCGEGAQLIRLHTRRSDVWGCGIDLSMAALQSCKKQNLAVVQGKGERLPFLPESFDGVICNVVLPYTDEGTTITEIGRVLRPGGTAYVVSHGAGYYVFYLLWGQAPQPKPQEAVENEKPSLKPRKKLWAYLPRRLAFRSYGARTLLNTWLWVWTGRRLPGFLGDSLYQSRTRLSEYYRFAGLERSSVHGPKYLGLPVFLYDRVKKTGCSH